MDTPDPRTWRRAAVPPFELLLVRCWRDLLSTLSRSASERGARTRVHQHQHHMRYGRRLARVSGAEQPASAIVFRVLDPSVMLSVCPRRIASRRDFYRQRSPVGLSDGLDEFVRGTPHISRRKRSVGAPLALTARVVMRVHCHCLNITANTQWLRPRVARIWQTNLVAGGARVATAKPPQGGNS